MDDKKINQLSNMLQSAVDQALILQATAKRTLEQSSNAAAELTRVSERSPRAVAAAVEKQLEAAAEAAAEKMATKWTEANAAAESATKTFAQAEATLGWKMLVYACTGILALAFLLAGVLVYLTPTERELKELRAERQALLADIDQLKTAGAGIQLARCIHNGKSKACVRVDPTSPSYEGGYMLVLEK